MRSSQCRSPFDLQPPIGLQNAPTWTACFVSYGWFQASQIQPIRSVPKRVSKISSSLKQLADIQVNEWDFMALLQKDVKDLDIAHSLKRLGNIQVMEWDFRTVLPAVNRLANQEVDLLDLVKRTAAYKVMDWDFKSQPKAAVPSPAEPKAFLTNGEMQALIVQLKDFLQYVVVSLIEQPTHAQIKVQELDANVLRFKLVLVKKDVLLVVGREGQSATAIRNTMKSKAKAQGVHVLLEIHSHEEEMALKFREEKSPR
jgi:predicted RNA-binding protein YlqC (UPF0109 family)